MADASRRKKTKTESSQQNGDGDGESSQSTTSNKKKKLEAKKRLCALIKAKPVIWSLTDPLYRRNDAKNVAWIEISEELGISVEKCKAQWKLIKDSLRRGQDS